MLCANLNMFAAGKNTPDSKTKISAPKKQVKNTGYFSKIDPEIVAGVENGSPQSLKTAMYAIRKAGGEYTESEKVLIQVAGRIMQYIWPSEKISWDIPEDKINSAYTGALDSVAQGIFDSSTGNSDFLTSIIPAMVVLNNDVSDETLDLCFRACETAMTFRKDTVLCDVILSEYYEKKGDFEKAEEIVSRILISCPENFETRLKYTQILLAEKKYSQANQVAAKLLEEKPGNIEILKANARIAFEMQDYNLAEEYVARVLQQTPNNLDFLLFRAVILIQKKDYIRAVSLLDMYGRQNDSNIDYLILRAKVQLDWSKNTILATQTIEKALALYPNNKEALLLAARIASATDSPVAGLYADELVVQILEDDKDNEEALLYAMNGLIQRQQWQEAYEISSQLQKRENPMPETVSKHAEICLQLGKKVESLECITKAYQNNPEDETLLQSYIFIQAKVGNKKQCLELINSMLDSSPAKIKSTLYYCRSLLQDSEALVLSDLRSSLIANPRNGDALFRLYEVYYGKNDYRKAQYYLKQVVALNPNDSSIKQLNESLTKLVQKGDNFN